MNKCIVFVIVATLFLFSVSASAKTITYDFKDPKSVNAVSIVVDSMLEPNTGYADGITGSVTIDHDAKKIIKGSITIPTEKITMSNPTMTKVLHSKEWLNKKKNPEVSFIFKQIISMTKTTDELYQVTVQGDMMINGVTKQLSAPVSLTFHPGKLGMRNRGADGDLVIMRTRFNISRNEFNINPGTPVEIVGDAISLTVNIAGAAK